jgi:hypothetical protein
LASNCNIALLWAVLQTAELNYYNDDFSTENDPGPRLAWVATMGSLLQQGI